MAAEPSAPERMPAHPDEIQAAAAALSDRMGEWIYADRSGFCGEVHREGYALGVAAQIAIEAALPVRTAALARAAEVARELEEARRELASTRQRIAGLEQAKDGLLGTIDELRQTIARITVNQPETGGA